MNELQETAMNIISGAVIFFAVVFFFWIFIMIISMIFIP